MINPTGHSLLFFYSMYAELLFFTRDVWCVIEPKFNFAMAAKLLITVLKIIKQGIGRLIKDLVQEELITLKRIKLGTNGGWRLKISLQAT